MSPPTTPLFRLVEEYAALGIHRSGTDSQAATAVWLADQLVDRGATVTFEEVDFERYVAEWSVTIDGDQVEALPLFYEATGSATSDDPVRWSAFAPPGSGPMGVTGGLSDNETRPGDVVVAATQNLLGLLAVSNRVPSLGSGTHVLQVAGEHGGALAGGAAVRAAIEVAARLASETPVLFLGATGHELGAFGAACFHAALGGKVDTLIHVGANVGGDWNASPGLAAPDHSYMAARFAGPSELHDGIRAAFAPTGHPLDTPARDQSLWFGEAADWLDTPCLLSLLGKNPWFHSPEDRPDVSCNAERTQIVADALTKAAFVIVRR